MHTYEVKCVLFLCCDAPSVYYIINENTWSLVPLSLLPPSHHLMFHLSLAFKVNLTKKLIQNWKFVEIWSWSLILKLQVGLGTIMLPASLPGAVTKELLFYFIISNHKYHASILCFFCLLGMECSMCVFMRTRILVISPKDVSKLSCLFIIYNKLFLLTLTLL